MRGSKVDPKQIVLLSCLGVMVLGRPPLPEETLGIVAIVGVRGVRRRVRHGSSRRDGRRLTGAGRKWLEAIIEDKPTDALMDDSCYGWEHSILPQAAEPLADQDLLL